MESFEFACDSATAIIDLCEILGIADFVRSYCNEHFFNIDKTEQL